MKDTDRKLIFEAYKQVNEGLSVEQLADSLLAGVAQGRDPDQILDILGWDEMGQWAREDFKNEVHQRIKDERDRTRAGSGGNTLLGQDSDLSRKVMNSRLFSDKGSIMDLPGDAETGVVGGVDATSDQAQSNMRGHLYDVVDALAECSGEETQRITQSVKSISELVSKTSQEASIVDHLTIDSSQTQGDSISLIWTSLHHRDKNGLSSEDGSGEFESAFKLTWKCDNTSMPYSYALKVDQNTRRVDYDAGKYVYKNVGQDGGIIRGEQDIVKAVEMLHQIIGNLQG